MEEFRQILTTGLLRIREASSLSFCQLEADHLHNIPAVMADPSRGLIDYYFNAEKPAFIARLSPEERIEAEQRYGKSWKMIGDYLGQ